MKKFVAVALTIAVIVILGVLATSSGGVPTTTPSTPTTKVASTITLVTVQTHNTASDCYMAIDGNVYDVTKYLDQGIHPGGNNMTPYCGMDASNVFNGVGGNGNGRGRMHVHSAMAKQLLASYLVGTLTN